MKVGDLVTWADDPRPRRIRKIDGECVEVMAGNSGLLTVKSRLRPYEGLRVWSRAPGPLPYRAAAVVVAFDEEQAKATLRTETPYSGDIGDFVEVDITGPNVVLLP